MLSVAEAEGAGAEAEAEVEAEVEARAEKDDWLAVAVRRAVQPWSLQGWLEHMQAHL